jgi:hypothetical protein
MKNKKPDAKIDPQSSEGTITTRAEQKQVEERLAIGANVVYETIRREGEEELHRPATAAGVVGFGCGTLDGIFVRSGRAANGDACPTSRGGH